MVAWVRGCEHLTESRRDCLCVLEVYRDCPGKLGKYINHGEQVPRSTVLHVDTLHIPRSACN